MSALIEDEALDRLAVRVAELLEPRLVEALEARSAQLDTGQLVDAGTVAQALGLSRATIYAHADELGAIRVGDGDKPRLRFDLEQARSAWRDSSREEPAPKPANRAARRRPRSAGAPLLPIRENSP